MGQHQRQPWFGCACCPSNICRFIPSVPGYVYAVKDKNIYVNLFMSNNAVLEIAGKKVSLSQTTSYPWNGNVKLKITQNSVGAFTLKIRIPGWVRNEVVPSDLYAYADEDSASYSIKVNGQKVYADLQNGYFSIQRKWKRGDCGIFRLSR